MSSGESKSSDPACALSAEQVAELKKVWAICDKDGSGEIDSSELRIVIEKLVGSKPSLEEIKLFMSRMDKDGDGTVNWTEFLSAVGAWVEEATTSTTPSKDGAQRMSSPSLTGRKRGRAEHSPPKANRAKIHKHIMSFFLQFKKAQSFDDLVSRYAQLKKGEREGGPDWRREPIYDAYDQKQELERLERSRKLLHHLSDIVEGINSNDVPRAVKCTKGLADLLSVCEVFQTPEKRYEIGEFLHTLFERVQEASVMPRICKFLKVQNNAELQFDALRVIAYFAPGPRIAHTPRDSLMHHSKMFHKMVIMRAGGLQDVCRLCLSNSQQVREQAVVTLGLFASHHAEPRDYLLSIGSLNVLCQQIRDDTPLSLLHKITWTVAVLCGHTHAPDHPPATDTVKKALPKLAYLFQRNDERTVINVLMGMHQLLPLIDLNLGLCQRLTKLLSIKSHRLHDEVLSLTADMMRLESETSALKPLMAARFPETCVRVLDTSDDSYIRIMACDNLMIMAAEHDQTRAILQAGALKVLLKVLQSDQFVRHRAAVVLREITRSGTSVIHKMVEDFGLIAALAKSMSHFKSYDPVLRKVYGYLGASYDFDLAECIIGCLQNILKAGEGGRMDSDAGDVNVFVDHFDMQCVENIKQVMMTLANDLPDQLDSWRSTHVDLSLEVQLRNLVVAIRSMHALKEQIRKRKAAEKRKNEAKTGDSPSKPRANDLDSSEAGTMSAQIMSYVSKFLKEFQAVWKKNEYKKKMEQKQLAEKEGKTSRSTSKPTSKHSHGHISSKSPRMTTFSRWQGGGRYARSEALDVPDDTETTLKTFLDGDNRVISVPRDIAFSSLRQMVQSKYATRLLLQYEDLEGDKMTIDSDRILEEAWKVWTDTGSFRLFLKAQSRSGGGRNDDDSFNFKRGKNSQANITELKYNNKQDMLNDMMSSTRFEQRELDKLYRTFKRLSNNSGNLDLKQFRSGMKELRVYDNAQVEQMFEAFDFDKDGFVSFSDFAIGLSMFFKGDREDRLKLCFQAYDLDGNGVIDKEELTEIFRSIYRVKGIEVGDDFIQNQVDKCFTECDVDGSADLDFEEFKNAVSQRQILLSLFWTDSGNTGSDKQGFRDLFLKDNNNRKNNNYNNKNNNNRNNNYNNNNNNNNNRNNRGGRRNNNRGGKNFRGNYRGNRGNYNRNNNNNNNNNNKYWGNNRN